MYQHIVQCASHPTICYTDTLRPASRAAGGGDVPKMQQAGGAAVREPARLTQRPRDRVLGDGRREHRCRARVARVLGRVRAERILGGAGYDDERGRQAPQWPRGVERPVDGDVLDANGSERRRAAGALLQRPQETVHQTNGAVRVGHGRAVQRA